MFNQFAIADVGTADSVGAFQGSGVVSAREASMLDDDSAVRSVENAPRLLATDCDDWPTSTVLRLPMNWLPEGFPITSEGSALAWNVDLDESAERPLTDGRSD